jgi:hypothetical protein
MPRAFDITASTSTVQLDASGQGEVSFTVSNALRQPVRVRAVVESSGGARPEWMSFSEGLERNLSPDGTAVFLVRLSVPKGTPPGTYGFSLVVASVANPDEHYARGPGVAFTVPEAEPEKKAFPWWLVALGVGVVLIVGGVVALLIQRGGREAPGLEEPCAERSPSCAAGLACMEGVCLGTAGFEGCERSAQCVTGRCADGTCREQLSLGEVCVANVDCRAPLRCHQGFCLIPNGQPCTHPSQCTSGNCVAGTCRREETRCPGPCPFGTVCRNGRCVELEIVIDPKILQELGPIRQIPQRTPIPRPGP